jgi:Kef-type K+ transport system membrane component KefB
MGHDLLAAIAVSVVAAAALALVARTLRQPLLLGYIAGGVVLGRHVGLGVVSDEASIQVISEIGLIFLLFIIGLEIDVPRVFQAGRTILVLGLLQFPVCAGLTWYTLRSAVAPFGGRLDGLYIAVALALSSTLIVVKLLYDKLEIATLAGRLTLGVLISRTCGPSPSWPCSPTSIGSVPGRCCVRSARGDCSSPALRCCRGWSCRRCFAPLPPRTSWC